MESDHIYDEILVRYLFNEASLEEEKWVTEWLNASESNRLYFQRLGDTLRLIEIEKGSGKINIDEEWNHFQQRKELSEQTVLPLHQYPEEDTLLIENRSRKAKVFRIIAGCTVAASLLFAIIYMPRLWNRDTAGKQPIAKKENSTGRLIDSALIVMLHEVNTSGKVKSIGLPDGSMVNLFNNSEITFREPAERNKREVVLKGKADFKVAKDKTKPFTVFSGAISTTALGTQFTVSAVPEEPQILVRLHEGKVVIRSVKPVGASPMKDVYLVPGEELIYDIQKGVAVVRSFRINNSLAGKADSNMIEEEPGIPNYDKRSWFMFNNQSLSEIFKQLEVMYNVKINYSKKDISKMYFIGTFDKSDSIGYILNQIAVLNNLELTKDSTIYTIKKNRAKKKSK